MAKTDPRYDNATITIGEDGLERVTDFQFIETHFASASAPPLVSVPEELPSSICPVCGSPDIQIVNGHGSCNDCQSEMTYSVELTCSTLADMGISNPCGEIKKEIPPVKKYKDIVSDINDRFKILDL